ncbi:hypothetical protein B0H13DRAFT_1860302 [Mycena leptocephala]|nr:hypothetical protein B0H13DRAFT_1860302 [Mycena leptocephala]
MRQQAKYFLDASKAVVQRENSLGHSESESSLRKTPKAMHTTAVHPEYGVCSMEVGGSDPLDGLQYWWVTSTSDMMCFMSVGEFSRHGGCIRRGADTSGERCITSCNHPREQERVFNEEGQIGFRIIGGCGGCTVPATVFQSNPAFSLHFFPTIGPRKMQPTLGFLQKLEAAAIPHADASATFGDAKYNQTGYTWE